MRRALLKLTKFIDTYSYVLLIVLIGSTVLGVSTDVFFNEAWHTLDGWHYALLLSSTFFLAIAAVSVGYYIYHHKEIHGWTKVGWCSTLGALVVTSVYNYGLVSGVLEYSPFSVQSLLSSHLMAFGIVMSVFGHSKGRSG